MSVHRFRVFCFRFHTACRERTGLGGQSRLSCVGEGPSTQQVLLMSQHPRGTRLHKNWRGRGFSHSLPIVLHICPARQLLRKCRKRIKAAHDTGHNKADNTSIYKHTAYTAYMFTTTYTSSLSTRSRWYGETVAWRHRNPWTGRIKKEWPVKNGKGNVHSLQALANFAKVLFLYFLFACHQVPHQ